MSDEQGHDRDGYPAEWECDVVLHDGGTVHVRPILHDDGDRLRDLLSRMSKESVFFRFLGPKTHLSDAEVAYYTGVDYVDRMALVAESGDLMVAVGRYDRLEDPTEAEVAFAVADAHQGRGIGTLLLEHLAVVAREHGIEHFVANVHGENYRMLQVFRDAGFDVDTHIVDGTHLVGIPLTLTDRAAAAIDERERHARAASVERILRPKSIAVIGAGRSHDSVGHVVLRNLLAGEFSGPVYPVNPHTTHVGGVPTFPSVEAVPGPVDLAVVTVPAAATLEVLQSCATAGVKALVLISAGYAETGAEGAALEREVVALAHRHDMRLVGPNCLGIACTSSDVSMDATFSPVAPRRGRAGFTSQSGALGIAMLAHAAEVGFGLSSFVSVGNAADVSALDLLEYWDTDPETSVALLYLESFSEPRRFARVARQVSRNKPIVAVKSGRTASGSRAARSHTAALASPDLAVDALFRQAGVIRVGTLGELLDVAAVLAEQPPPRGRRIAIVSNAGGPAILAADACESAGLEVPALSPTTQAAIEAVALPGAAVRNPVDLIAAATPEQFEVTVKAVLADDMVDGVIVAYTPVLMNSGDAVAAAVDRAAESQGQQKPVVATFFGGRPRTAGVPVVRYPESAATSLAHAAWYAEWCDRPEGEVPALAGIDIVGARNLASGALAREEQGGWLDTGDAFALCGRYGIAVASSETATTPQEAASAAERVGCPVALKATGPQLLHKSDVGGVVLDLPTPEAASAAFARMQAHLGARMDGALVQEMAPEGFEAIVGSVSDPNFGPVLMFGLGGTAAELLEDRAMRILPITDLDAADLVRGLRSSPLLFGYRGAPALDVAALEDLLLRVGRMLDDIGQIAEMDLNPVVVSTSGILVVDARIRLAPASAHPELTVRRLG